MGKAKVMISLDRDVLECVDAEARRRGTSRSRLLQEAARKAYGRPERDELQRRLESLRAFADSRPQDDRDSAELVREMRDERHGRAR